jgi:hypothetical protein
VNVLKVVLLKDYVTTDLEVDNEVPRDEALVVWSDVEDPIRIYEGVASIGS